MDPRIGCRRGVGVLPHPRKRYVSSQTLLTAGAIRDPVVAHESAASEDCTSESDPPVPTCSDEQIANAQASKKKRRPIRPWDSIEADGYATSEEVSNRCGCGVGTLRNWRLRGEGPPFHRVTPRMIRYRKDQVDAWLAERRVHSTSEAISLA